MLEQMKQIEEKYLSFTLHLKNGENITVNRKNVFLSFATGTFYVLKKYDTVGIVLYNNTNFQTEMYPWTSVVKITC